MLTANRIRPRLRLHSGARPWNLFEQLQGELNRELSDWFGSGTARDWSAGVWTNESAALVALDLPGRELTDFDVSVHRNLLQIEAGRSNDDSLPESARLLRRERSRESLQRRFEFPFEIAPESVAASYEQGRLVIRLSAHAAAQPAKIEVKAG